MEVLRRLWRRQEGQSLVTVALSMVAMIGIIGLAIDVGLIMGARRNLVRLTDAAALAAASALSGPSSVGDDVKHGRATDRVYEYVRLNGFDPTPSTGNISVTITFPSTTPQRKIVEVTTQRRVRLAFMRLFGLYDAVVSSSARQGESVPLDVVMVMDISGSQFLGNHELSSDAYDLVQQPWPVPLSMISSWQAGGGDRSMLASGFGYSPTLKTIDYYWPPTSTVLAPNNVSTKDGRVNVPWQPFAMQQEAAHYFIGQLDPRYDKVAIACFSSSGYNKSCAGLAGACVVQQLTNQFADANNAIGSSPTVSGTRGVKGLVPLGGTAMASGIKEGLRALTTYPPARQDAVGAMILLTDGSPTHRLSGGACSGCDENHPESCGLCRSDVMDQARLAASKGIVICTIFVGSAAWETQKALILQWVADLTDNGQLEGNYSSPRNLPTGYGPAFDGSWFQTNVSANYYRAETQAELEAAYQSIFEKIYTRLLK